MKFSEVKAAMRQFNEKHGIERKVCDKHTPDGELIEMVAKVIIKNSKLVREFPVEQRTYTFNNYNKALTSSDLGYSIFAYCEADDDCMRIENYSDEDFEFAEIIKTEDYTG